MARIAGFCVASFTSAVLCSGVPNSFEAADALPTVSSQIPAIQISSSQRSRLA
jgi:hypothetical protein